jgi:3,4-dihydroxy 2-butanone 4-phosphate synthase
MAHRDDCWRFAREWGLKCISIEDMRKYLATEKGDAVPKV